MYSIRISHYFFCFQLHEVAKIQKITPFKGSVPNFSKSGNRCKCSPDPLSSSSLCGLCSKVRMHCCLCKKMKEMVRLEKVRKQKKLIYPSDTQISKVLRRTYYVSSWCASMGAAANLWGADCPWWCWSGWESRTQKCVRCCASTLQLYLSRNNN